MATCQSCNCSARYCIEGALLCGRHTPQTLRLDKYRIGSVETAQVQPVLMHKPDDKKGVVFYNTTNNRYGAFSMFAPTPFTYQNIKWRSAEHAYQAMKFYHRTGNEHVDKQLLDHIKAIVTTVNPLNVRELGHERRVPIMSMWNAIGDKGFKKKVEFMFDIITAKVDQNPSVAKLLMDTGDETISEGSANDDFWSIGSDGKGENMLGRVYMMVRDALKRKQLTVVYQQASTHEQ
jgi:N-glycosidase YbiA